MARVIEFYVPQNFKPTARWVPVGIPVKANIDSGGKANGIPERR